MAKDMKEVNITNDLRSPVQQISVLITIAPNIDVLPISCITILI